MRKLLEATAPVMKYFMAPSMDSSRIRTVAVKT